MTRRAPVARPGVAPGDGIDRRVDVVVVGGGLSGLVAAHELDTAGYDVIVLEARDRVGGRLASATLGGRTVDTGGQWIGPSQHRIHALVHELGLETYPQHHHGKKVLVLEGKRSTYRGTIPSLLPHALIDLQIAMMRLERMAKRVSLAHPCENSKASTWDSITLAGWLRRHVRTRSARALFAAATRVILGAEPDEISFLFFLAYVRSAGGIDPLISVEDGAQQSLIEGGAFGVAERLQQRLDGAVALSRPVQCIDESPSGVEVRTTNGETIAARYAIVAVPPPMLARIAFDPPLPPWRAQLLGRTQMGAACKVYLAYRDAFWRERGLSGELVTDGLICTAWDASGPAAREPALLAFVMGRPLRRWQRLSATQRRSAIVGSLTRAFGARAEEVEAYLEHDWGREAFAAGGPVTLMPPGVLCELGPVLRMPRGRIHFAGTETAIRWAGFMDGAVGAGQRAAREVRSELSREDVGR